MEWILKYMRRVRTPPPLHTPLPLLLRRPLAGPACTFVALAAGRREGAPLPQAACMDVETTELGGERGQRERDRQTDTDRQKGKMDGRSDLKPG